MALRLGLVVPCYNEEAVLTETAPRLLDLLDRLAARDLIDAASTLTFVDDGSRDGTWGLIESFAAADARVHGIKLSRNRGHQAALLAGLFGSPGDALVSLDADLQDDPEVIAQMVERHLAGAEIVYGVRASREVDSGFKRGSARLYYRLLGLLGVEVVPQHADFRLLGRRALEALGGFGEVNLFLRGIVPLLGFRTDSVRYDRAARFAGDTKYPLRRMIALALDGVTSFSVVPLRLISVLGILICLASLGMVAWVAYGKLVLGTTLAGWASSVIPIYFLGGLQLLGLGVVGEYIAKIYLETKRRPRYLVEKQI